MFEGFDYSFFSINENTKLVRFRKHFLEKFLNQISKIKEINESCELSKFLGHDYDKLIQVKRFLSQTKPASDRTKTESSASRFSTKNFNLKDILKVFMPTQAKYGKLPTKIDDVAVNEKVDSKYSVQELKVEADATKHMMMQTKLNKWLHSMEHKSMDWEENSCQSAQETESSSSSYHSTEDIWEEQISLFAQNEKLERALVDCILVSMLKPNFVLKNYLSSKILYFIKLRQTK